jgi:hypothetical protein
MLTVLGLRKPNIVEKMNQDINQVNVIFILVISDFNDKAKQ